MLRMLVGLGVFLTLVGQQMSAAYGEDKPIWKERDLKKMAGSWTTVREEKVGNKIVKRRLVLEFSEDKLKISSFKEDVAKPVFEEKLTFSKLEQTKGVGLAFLSRFILVGSPQQEAEIYYDFVGEKLILVGQIGWRPWEGFQLSGEYSRPEKSK